MAHYSTTIREEELRLVMGHLGMGACFHGNFFAMEPQVPMAGDFVVSMP